jgi:hypothetical protein
MSDAGDRIGALDPETAGRLRAHAERIVKAAGVPAHAREDLTDELYGHLLERTAALVADGRSWTDAADRAINALGGVDELAPDLATAFHSRLWSSTIGVLLPAVAAREDRPAVIGWMRLALVIGMVLAVVGLGLTLFRATPVHLVVMTASLLLGLAGLLLAFEGLARGQRWALWYGIAFAAQLVVFGLISVVEASRAGSWNIPIGGLLGAGILLGAASAWDRLQRFVSDSRPIGRGLAAVLVASLIAPLLVPPAVAAIPDPTQASADDLRLTLSVTCDRGNVLETGFPPQHDVQRVTIEADMAWRRGDLLPNGLDGLINPTHYGDTAGFRLLDGSMGEIIPDWILVPDASDVIYVASGEPAGWFGATSPSVELLPETIGSFTVGVDPDAIRSGRTLRSTWLLVPSADGDAAWPRVEVAYAHLDRFLLLATAGCGESAVATDAGMR